MADLAALAARQLAAIRTVVGDGPFHVAGWSLGGMAAHAVGALARGQGQDVRSVTALDAYPAEQWQDLAEPTEHDALVGILRLAGLDAPAEVTVDRAAVAALLRRSGSALAALEAPVLDGCIARVIEARRLVRTSTAEPMPGDLTLVEAVTLPATHAELVRRPMVAEVAQVLLRHLAR